MTPSDEPLIIEDPITEVPRKDNRRYVAFALLVIVAIVLGLRRTRTKPVASDAGPPETES